MKNGQSAKDSATKVRENGLTVYTEGSGETTNGNAPMKQISNKAFIFFNTGLP